MTQVDDPFKVHVLNKQGMTKARQLQDCFGGFLKSLEEICGADGREMTVVRTKLQEASFFAKRAMAIKPENQA